MIVLLVLVLPIVAVAVWLFAIATYNNRLDR